MGIRLRIRDATADDLPALRDIFRRAALSNQGDRANLLAHQDALELSGAGVGEGRTRVAQAAGRVVGFATVATAGGGVELEDLFVAPEAMRRGVGTRLVRDAAEAARGRGARRLEVTANDHARAFYVRCGFIAAGTAPTRFGPAARMHLALTAPSPRRPGPCRRG